METLTYFLFAIIILLLVIGNIYQYLSNKKVKESDSTISNDTNDKREMLPGNRVLVEYYLSYGKKGTPDHHPFSVVYECNIIDISENMVKIETVDFTSTDKKANEPQNKPGILNFLNERWINKSEAQLVVDDSKRREDKINQILGS